MIKILKCLMFIIIFLLTAFIWYQSYLFNQDALQRDEFLRVLLSDANIRISEIENNGIKIIHEWQPIPEGGT